MWTHAYVIHKKYCDGPHRIEYLNWFGVGLGPTREENIVKLVQYNATQEY